MTVAWDDDLDTIFAGDLTVGGLTTRQHTGWLEVDDDGGARYAPHTETGYKAPANKTLLLLLNGALAKKGVRAAAKAKRSPAR
jgi:hypothetical protein